MIYTLTVVYASQHKNSVYRHPPKFYHYKSVYDARAARDRLQRDASVVEATIAEKPEFND